MAEPEVNRYALRSFETHTFQLKSLFKDHVWENGVAIAHCLRDNPCPDDIVPNDGCACGLYGHLTLDKLVGDYRKQAIKCVAVIEAEGKTILGPRGLKTKAARIVAYWCATLSEKEVFDVHAPEAQHFPCIDEMLAKYHFPAYEANWNQRRDGPVPDWWDARYSSVSGLPRFPLYDNHRRETAMPRPRRVGWGDPYSRIAPMMTAATPAGIAVVQQILGGGGVSIVHSAPPPRNPVLPSQAPTGTVVCDSWSRPKNPPIGQLIFENDTRQMMVYGPIGRWERWNGGSFV